MDIMMVSRSQYPDLSHYSFDFLRTWVAVVPGYQNNAEQTEPDPSFWKSRWWLRFNHRTFPWIEIISNSTACPNSSWTPTSRKSRISRLSLGVDLCSHIKLWFPSLFVDMASSGTHDPCAVTWLLFPRQAVYDADISLGHILLLSLARI